MKGLLLLLAATAGAQGVRTSQSSSGVSASSAAATYVNKAGDTMTGDLNLTPSTDKALVSGTGSLILSDSGNGGSLLRNANGLRFYAIGSGGAGLWLSGTTGLAQFGASIDGTPLGQLEVRSAQTPSAYTLAVSSQNAAMMAGVRGDGGGFFSVAGSTFGAGGILGYQDYTMVQSTTVNTTGLGTFVVFSTITIPANTLANNGDTLILKCAGTFNNVVEFHTVRLQLGGVTVSSRTLSAGVAGLSAPWEAEVTLIRTSAGNQVRSCGGGGATFCNVTAASPSLGFGTSTLDETSALAYTCAGDNQTTTRSMSFLYNQVEFKPGRR